MIQILNSKEVSREEIFARAVSTVDVTGVCAEIIANVRARGDAALLEYSEKFDRVTLSSLEVTEAEIEEALSLVEPEFFRILTEAAENIRAFHEKQVRNSFIISEKNGIVMGQKILPIERVGLYVPGGTAAYPSTVLMDAIPAKLAGLLRDRHGDASRAARACESGDSCGGQGRGHRQDLQNRRRAGDSGARIRNRERARGR